ncbi:MAG: FxsA family protein [Nocardioides sp.]|uniref:FxsA family protein n=1 Tax=Nocardioides sp. TaxID=35761 RepID=UPI003F025A55
MTGTKRRGGAPWVLLLLVVPLLEIFVIAQVGSAIGVWWTLALLVVSGALGVWLVAREGRRAWRSLRTAVQQGLTPARELADGALVLIGGALLVFPGFVTDVLGLVLVLPFTRPLARGLLTAAIGRRFAVIPDVRRPGPSGSGPVVRGDVVD